MSTQCSSFLKLPDELLLSIARSLDTNSHLCQLSLVCHKLRHVAQEALIKEVSLPKCGMRELIRTLCDRPDLCDKINSVDLDDYTCSGRSRDGVTLAEWSHYHQCRAIVGVEVFDRISRYWKHEGDILLWPEDHQFFLDVLIAACSNLKELTLRLPASEQDRIPVLLGQEEGHLLDPFSGVSRDLLKDRLQILTIRQTEIYRLFQTPNVNLSIFAHLTRLSIPSDALVYMASKPSIVSQTLPTSLRHLQIQPCNRYILLWFPDLATACLGGKLPKLCKVDIYFKDCLKDSLLLINQGRDFLQPLRGVIRLLNVNYGISFRGYNESGVFTGDLLKELDAWSFLSTTELWYPAPKNAEFSSIVARTKEGAFRHRSKEEICLYIKQERPRVQSATTRNYRFRPDIQLDSIVCRSFFANVEGLPLKPENTFTHRFARWLYSIAITQRKSESPLRVVPKQLRAKSSVFEGTPAVSPTFHFKGSSDCPYPWLAFNPKHWLDVNFFEHRSTNMANGRMSSHAKNNCKRKQTVGPRLGGKARRVKAKISDGE